MGCETMDCIQSLGSDPQPVFSFRGPYRSEANSNQCLPMSTFNSRRKDVSRFAWSLLASWVTIDATLTETHQKLVVDVNRFLAVFEARSTELDAIRALSWGQHKSITILLKCLIAIPARCPMGQCSHLTLTSCFHPIKSVHTMSPKCSLNGMPTCWPVFPFQTWVLCGFLSPQVHILVREVRRARCQRASARNFDKKPSVRLL